MGTRSLTVFTDEQNNEICIMYRQFDGYPECHGQELANFLSGIKIVNGLTENMDKVANGIDCLTAQVISYFKTEPGGIYVYPPGSRNCGEDYIYFVTGKIGEEPRIKVDCGEVGKFDGPASEFAHFLEEIQDKDNYYL